MTNFKLIGMHCEDLRFKMNVIKAEPQTKFEIKPEFNRQIKKVQEIPRRRIVELTVKILSTDDSPKPFDLGVRLVSAFDLEDDFMLVEDEKEFIIEATRMVFPYLRSIVTNLTAAAMINPLMLPPIDGGALFPEDKK